MATLANGCTWFPKGKEEWDNMSYEETAYIMYGVDIDDKKNNNDY